jgi:hypothetical protein
MMGWMAPLRHLSAKLLVIAVLLHRGRERLVRQRTGLVNALAHLAEFGIIAPQGLRHVGRLTAIVRDEGDARLSRGRSGFSPDQAAQGCD